MTPGAFSVIQTGDLLRVTLSGSWRLTTELAYLTEMAERIHDMIVRGRPWGVLVDMLDWDGNQPQWPAASPALDVLLDRRNQVCECWIVRDHEQALALEHFVLMHGFIAFARRPQQRAAISWLKSFALDTGVPIPVSGGDSAKPAPAP